MGAITILANNATQLAFTTSPSTTNTAGTNLSAQPIVQARDAGGSLVNTYTTGMTVVDWRGQFGRPANCDVLLGIDAPRLVEMFTERLSRPVA